MSLPYLSSFLSIPLYMHTLYIHMHIYVCVLVYTNYTINRFLAILHIFPSLCFLTPSVLHEMTSNLPPLLLRNIYPYTNMKFSWYFSLTSTKWMYIISPLTLLIPIIFCISFTESIPLCSRNTQMLTFTLKITSLKSQQCNLLSLYILCASKISHNSFVELNHNVELSHQYIPFFLYSSYDKWKVMGPF